MLLVLLTPKTHFTGICMDIIDISSHMEPPDLSAIAKYVFDLCVKDHALGLQVKTVIPQF